MCAFLGVVAAFVVPWILATVHSFISHDTPSVTSIHVVDDSSVMVNREIWFGSCLAATQHVGPGLTDGQIPPRFRSMQGVTRRVPPEWVALPTLPGRMMISTGFGWPLISHVRDFDATNPDQPRAVHTYTLELGERRIHLPLRIVARPLIINSAVHGVAAFLMLTLLVEARPAVRRRRGRCPACGYDLRHDHASGCPECGWNRGSLET